MTSQKCVTTCECHNFGSLRMKVKHHFSDSMVNSTLTAGGGGGGAENSPICRMSFMNDPLGTLYETKWTE